MATSSASRRLRSARLSKRCQKSTPNGKNHRKRFPTTVSSTISKTTPPLPTIIARKLKKAHSPAALPPPPTNSKLLTPSPTSLTPRSSHAPPSPNGDNRMTVWTGTQRPFAVRTEVANALHIPESSVRVIVPDTGSAYGGKHTGDAAVEAARLAKAANRPVKLVWTREEEFTWAYFRPAGLIEVKSGLDASGKL